MPTVNLKSLSIAALLILALTPAPAAAQAATVAGRVTDETGGALPGVLVQLLGTDRRPEEAITDARGHYSFDMVAAGRRELVFGLINFARVRRPVHVPPSGDVRVEVTLHLSMSADVTVTGKRTFTNLADAEDPAMNRSASRSQPVRARSPRGSWMRGP
jgi:TonB-dependent starch-binding outer membrane protein SusC